MKDYSLNIYQYLEYRDYLRDFYDQKKRINPNFSYRIFSKKAKVKAPNFLQLLILGKRNLGVQSISQVSEAIGHTSEESEYFRLLVLFDQEKNIEEKSRYFNRLNDIRKPYKIENITDKQFKHYSNWYNQAIRELLGFYEFFPKEKFAYRKLASLVSPAIKESEARNAVKAMLKLGLLKEKNGRVVQTHRFLTTGDEVKSLFIRKFHETMIEHAKGSLNRGNKEQRDVSCLTVTVSENGFNSVKDEIKAFRKRLLEVVKDDFDPLNVYQVNFQLFPLTDVKKMKNAMKGDKK